VDSSKCSTIESEQFKASLYSRTNKQTTVMGATSVTQGFKTCINKLRGNMHLSAANFLLEKNTSPRLATMYHYRTSQYNCCKMSVRCDTVANCKKTWHSAHNWCIIDNTRTLGIIQTLHSKIRNRCCKTVQNF